MIDKVILKELSYESMMPHKDDHVISGLIDGGYIREFNKNSLVLPVRRYQKLCQAGELSLRLGVCYLPRDGRNDHYFNKPYKTYGGDCKYEYELAVKAPLFVRAGCGGSGYKIAYKLGLGNLHPLLSILIGKKINDEDGLFDSIKNYLAIFVKPNKYYEHVFDITTELANGILHYSKVGNQFKTALEEIAYFDYIRHLGYDSVVCYNKTRDGRYFINEIADLRTIYYPFGGIALCDPSEDVHSRYIKKVYRAEAII